MKENNNTTTVRIEIDTDIYGKYKRTVKDKNQLLKGYSNDLFLKSVMKELKRSGLKNWK